MIEITDRPIEVQKIITAASQHEAGAINTFIGTVRNQTSGKKVLFTTKNAVRAAT